jgi:hypothetical protein
MVEDTLHALARLAVQRDRLRKERAELEPQLPHAEKFHEVVMVNLGAGHSYSDDELKEIDRLMKLRKWLLKRAAEIDARLAQIQKDGVIVKKHCQASRRQCLRRGLRNKEAYALGWSWHSPGPREKGRLPKEAFSAMTDERAPLTTRAANRAVSRLCFSG